MIGSAGESKRNFLAQRAVVLPEYEGKRRTKCLSGDAPSSNDQSAVQAKDCMVKVVGWHDGFSLQSGHFCLVVSRCPVIN